MAKQMWIGVATAAAFATVGGAAVAHKGLPARAAEPAIGSTAPDFSARNASYDVVRLSDFRGKTVVLEWNNPGCPFVQKHYESGNMQRTQRAAIDQGVVWLTINSGAPGQQGHMNGSEAASFVRTSNAAPLHYLLDPDGMIGRGYDARTTPQMVIIDPQGRVRYNGAIDDKPTRDVTDIQSARNHVLAALEEMQAGREVSVPETRPYGCSVKYAQ